MFVLCVGVGVGMGVGVGVYVCAYVYVRACVCKHEHLFRQEEDACVVLHHVIKKIDEYLCVYAQIAV